MKTWKAGKADEDWKVAICERDIMDSERILSSLCYILTDAASNDAGLYALRQMSGDDIVNGVLAYRASRVQSIKNGGGA